MKKAQNASSAAIEVDFGPVQEPHRTWRILTNFEVNALIQNAEIVKFGRVQRIRWLHHIFGMDEERNTKNITVCDFPKPDPEEDHRKIDGMYR